MNARYKYAIAAIFAVTLNISNATAADPEEHSASPKPRDIPTSWGTFFLDEETLETHKGERVRKFCLDDDFLANPNGFESEMVISRIRTQSGGPRVSRVKKLRGGVDFVVVGENAVIITLPKAGNHLVETRDCRRNLHRTKFIRFTDDINRTRLNRCVQRRQSLSIQTRLHKSGFKGCEIVNIHEWNGPVTAPDMEATTDNEPAPIILE